LAAPEAGIGVGAAKEPSIDLSVQVNMSERINRTKKHKDLSFVNGVDIGNSFGLLVGLSRVRTSYN
jgi:hypothetical protein